MVLEFKQKHYPYKREPLLSYILIDCSLNKFYKSSLARKSNTMILAKLITRYDNYINMGMKHPLKEICI
jgi:hypothetical protein